MASKHPYYVIWTGRLNLGDTPGVFADAAFAGLLVQLPFTVTFAVPEPKGKVVTMLLTTTEVEIFNKQTHPIFFDWQPGKELPKAVGQIDDEVIVEGHPEIHRVEIPAEALTKGPHTLTILVNPDVAATFKDDFVVLRWEVEDVIGAKFGW